MSPSRHRILLIDDDPNISSVVSKALRSDEYELVYARSGKEGIAQAQAHHPDLILLDVMMPEMDGYTVCGQLRRNSATAGTPVIMLTALDEIPEKVLGLQAGADDYITKPCNLEDLHARVQAHLRRSERDLNASPLTHLPGNPLIEEAIRARLLRHDPTAVLYIDLTNFKEYNDEYGWIHGDDVIRLLARIVKSVVVRVGRQDDFIGHIGGDDFCIVTQPDCAANIAQDIITHFDAAIPSYYNATDRAHGYIETRDRHGKPFRAPIVTVAIAIVTNTRRPSFDPIQVAAVAADVKRHLKAHTGSHYGFDRLSK